MKTKTVTQVRIAPVNESMCVYAVQTKAHFLLRIRKFDIFVIADEEGLYEG
jgi:hypothetical protein